MLCPGVAAFAMAPRPPGSGPLPGNGAHALGAGGANGSLAFGFDGFAGGQPVPVLSAKGTRGAVVLLLSYPRVEPPRVLRGLQHAVDGSPCAGHLRRRECRHPGMIVAAE